MKHRLVPAIGAVSILLAVVRAVVGALHATSLDVVALLYQLKKTFGIELTLPEVLSPPAPPELSLSVAPLSPTKGGEVSIHVRVHNAGEEGLQGHQLLVRYAMRDESSVIGIVEVSADQLMWGDQTMIQV